MLTDGLKQPPWSGESGGPTGVRISGVVEFDRTPRSPSAGRCLIVPSQMSRESTGRAYREREKQRLSESTL